MGIQEGRNAGVTGIIDLPNQAGKFEVWARAFESDLTSTMLPAAGRGDSEWPEQRPLSSGGLVSVGGQVRLDGWHGPDKFRGEKGTLTLTQHSGVIDTYPVRVQREKLTKSDKEQGLWNFTLVCQIIADPTSAGWGAGRPQPAAATEVLSDKELWEGLLKNVDPQGLASTAQQRILVWGVGDNDAAETTKVNAMLGALGAPFANLKQRAGTFTRLSKNAATVVVTWGLTDTAEDVVNPITATTLDPQHLASAAAAAAINATPAPPSGDQFVLRSSTSNELNDQKQLHKDEYGLRDTKDDVEMPGTITGNDPYDLEDNGTITKVHDTATPPADPPAPLGQLVLRQTEQLNRIKWRTTWTYANTNSVQKVQFPEDVTGDDPQDLEDTDQQSAVTNSSTPPATPASRFNDGKLRRISSRRVGGTPAQWLHVWEFGRRSTADDITMPGTVTVNEVSDIEDEATITLLNASSTAPATPAAPVGQLLSIEHTQIHGSDGGRWKHVFRYGNTTALQKIQFPTDVLSTDPVSSLADEDQQSDVAPTSTPPATPSPRVAGLVLRQIVSVRIAGTPEKWLHRWRFGRRSTAQDITFPGTVTADEVSDIADEATVTLLNTSSTPPATPVAPLGQLLKVTSEQLTNSGQWKHTFEYGNTTALQKIQFPTDVQETDPSQLEDEDHQSATTATSTPPTVPAPRITGLALRRIVSVRIAGTPEKWLHRWTFGRRSTEQDVTFPGTVTSNEISDIADQATITLVTASSSPPMAPSAPVGQLLIVRSEQLTSAGKWKHTFEYGNTTALQHIQFPTDTQESDPAQLTDEDRQSQTTGDSTVPGAPSPRIAGLVLRSVLSRRISGTPEKWLHQWTFGRRSTAEDITFPGSVKADDVSDLRDRAAITQVTGSATPPATPAAPLGQLVSITSEQLTDAGKWKHTFGYANTTAQQEVEFGGTVNEDDPKDLIDEDRQTIVNTSSTPPATPTPTPSTLKLKRRVSQQIAGTPTKWKHTFFFARTDTKDDIELPNTFTSTDPADLKSTGQQTGVYDPGIGPPSAAVPSGQQLVGSRTIAIHASRSKVLYEFGKDTSKQQVEQSNTFVVTDSKLLASHARVAAVDATPNLPGGMVERSVRSEQVTHDHTLTIREAGLRTTQDDIEMPGTSTTIDPADLISAGKEASVFDAGDLTPAPQIPTGLQLVSSETEQLNIEKNVARFTFAKDTSKQKIEQEHSYRVDDPQSLQSLAHQAAIDATPAAPTAPTGGSWVTRATRSEQVTHDHVLNSLELGLRSTDEDVSMPGTFTVSDPKAIETEGKVTSVYTTSSGVPATPAAPAGTQLVTSRSNALNRIKSQALWEYGVLNTEQKRTFPRTRTTSDPKDLGSEQISASIFDNASPPSDPAAPSGLKLDDKYDLPVTPSKSMRVWEFRKTDSQDRAENPHIWTLADPNSIGSEASAAAMDGAPALPAGFVNRGSRDVHLTDDHVLTILTGGLRSTVDDIEMPGTITVTDPNAIESEGRKASVFTTASGTPADPTPPAGLQIVTRQTEKLNTLKSVAKWTFSVNSSRQKLEFPQTRTETDPRDLISDTFTAAVFTTASPPSDPAAPAGQKLRLKRDIVITPALSLRVYQWAKSDSKDELQQKSTFTLTDPQGLESKAQAALVDGTPTLPVGYVSRGSRVENVTPDHTLTVVQGGLRTTSDDVEMPGTFVNADPQGIDSTGKTTQVYTTASGVPVTPAAPSGQQLLNQRTQALNQTKSQAVWEFAVVNSKQREEFRRTETVTDPNDLTSFTIKAQVFTTGSAPADPALPSGQKLVDKRDYPLTAALSIRVWKYAKRDTKDELALPRTFTITDPTGLTSTGSAAAVDASPIVPGGLVARATRTENVTPDHVLNIVEAGTRTTQQDVEFPGTFTITDPQALDSSGIKTTVHDTSATPADPTPPTGLKIVDKKLEQHNNTKSITRWSFGVLDNKDKIELGNTRTIDNPLSGIDSRDASLIACLNTDTASALAQAGWTANEANPFFAGIELRKATPTLALKTILTADDDKKYETIGFRSGWEELKSDGASVQVSQVRTAGSAQKWAYIVPTARYRTRGLCVLRRRLHAPLGSGDLATAITRKTTIGTANNGVFLGWPAGTLMYVGPRISGHFRSSSDRLFLVDYLFEFDSLGHYNDSIVSLGWVLTTGSVSVGFNSVSAFGWTLSPATLGDLSVFFS